MGQSNEIQTVEPGCLPSGSRQAMEAAGIPPLAAAVLCARGLDTPEKAAAFLDAGLGQLRDPLLMKDMDKAAARVARSPGGRR